MSNSERGRTIGTGGPGREACEEFAQLESLDNGKPLTVARVADVPATVDMFRYMAGWATKVEGNTIPLSVRRQGSFLPTRCASRWASLARLFLGISRY